jgi:hypothetical protein
MGTLHLPDHAQWTLRQAGIILTVHVCICLSGCSPCCAPSQSAVLKSMSVVVADTGEPELVKKFKPVDCTTNPRY